MRRPVLAAALAGALLAPAGAHAGTIGPGHKPGVAVDAAGTAFIAWYGPEAGTSSLRFCRLPRGAQRCDIANDIVVPGGTSASRPFVAVAGNTVRVVQYRYGFAGGDFGRALEFVSTNRGLTWSAGRQIGIQPFDEAVAGPGSTLTAAAGGHDGGSIQSMPLGGGTAGDDRAILMPGRPYDGTVGLVDATTPLAVFTSGSGVGAFRRYSAGSLNDPAGWTPETEIGDTHYPRLAGGRSGLFLLAGRASNALVVRRWNGSTFTPGVAIGASREMAHQHLAQDPAGRLHAVYPSGERLVHATSDDGVRWQSSAVLAQTDGAIRNLRAAVAPDHVGVVVWDTGLATGPAIRFAAIGPGAPVAVTPPPPGTGAPPPPAARPTPAVAARGSAKRRGRKVRIAISGRLVLPAGVATASGCRGTVRVTVKRGRKVIAARRIAVRPSCTFRLRGSVRRSRARRLSIVIAFAGNEALAPAVRRGSLRVRR
jgi:hypothetical protein